MQPLRILLFSAATMTVINISIVAHAQSYGPPPGYSRPPCQAVTPGPLQGAGRGAAGGALIGAISGNAGRGAAIGAGFGALRGAVRRGRPAVRASVIEGHRRWLLKVASRGLKPARLNSILTGDNYEK